MKLNPPPTHVRQGVAKSTFTQRSFFDGTFFKSAMACCGVCTEATPKLITCPSCDFATCKSCQKRYEKPACMLCRVNFSREFCRFHFGSVYVSKVYRPFAHSIRLEAERFALPAAQPFVDWELNRRKIVENRRFGMYTPIPAKPARPPEPESGNGFACPSSECRGFVFAGKCGLCRKKVCAHCREFSQDEHVCDANTVETLKALAKDTKSCPNCRTPIHKTEGCDHMKCTFCGSHFSYKTLRVLKTSTNHHYDAAAPINASTSTNAADLCELDFSDGIPRDAFSGPRDLVKLLYDDRDTILFMFESCFEEEKIIAKASDALHDARVRFLLKEISETRWSSTIMKLSDVRDRGLACAEILRLLLVELKLLQHEAHSSRDSANIKVKLVNLYAMARGSFDRVHDEFSGERISVRSMEDVDKGIPCVYSGVRDTLPPGSTSAASTSAAQQ